MEELYKDKYVTFSYDPVTKIMYEHWTPVTEDMDTEEFKNLMEKLVSFFKTYETLCSEHNTKKEFNLEDNFICEIHNWKIFIKKGRAK